MNLQTQISLEKAKNQIDYSSQLLLLGSCFSENIGKKFEYFKYQSLQNPFGILFHPKSIENLIYKSVNQVDYSEKDVFFNNERWHCFDAHSDLSDTSKEQVLDKLNKGLEDCYRHIKDGTHIIITLGTAWVYRRTEILRIVANCHKVPQKEFVKQLLSVEEIINSLTNIMEHIKSVNSKVQFIFTVSPVRHLKDGFVENQVSKAHLIAALHKLKTTSDLVPLTSYFEGYEIMMDELRDYRFYETDMVHPSQLAIDYIWEKFKSVWISETAYPTMEDVGAVQKGLQHKPFNPDSEGHLQFKKSLQEKITYLQQYYPHMIFDQ